MKKTLGIFIAVFCAMIVYNIIVSRCSENIDITKDTIYQDSIKVLEMKVLNTKSMVDSLLHEILDRESIIDSLLLSRKEIIIEKKIEVDRIKNLSTTSSIEYLNKKLRKYEND